MKPTLAVYVNEDDALLLWTVDALDPGCRGFAIQRERNGGAAEWLDNYAPPGPNVAPGRLATRAPTSGLSARSPGPTTRSTPATPSATASCRC